MGLDAGKFLDDLAPFWREAKATFSLGVDRATGRLKDPYNSHRDMSKLPIWKDSADVMGTSDLDYIDNPLMKAVYGAGRLTGDVLGDNTRYLYWRYNHPLAIVSDQAQRIAKQTGLNRTHAALLGFGMTQAMDILSGNTDPFNLAQGGRPKGYSAIFPSAGDPTQSYAPLLELPVRYIVGGRNKLLAPDKFFEERPDVNPENYQEYRKYQEFGRPGLFGIEKVDPFFGAGTGATIGGLRAAMTGGNPLKQAIIGGVAGSMAPALANVASSLGVVKGTWKNLEGQPEIQGFGYKVPLTALLGTAALGYGAKKLLSREWSPRFMGIND